MTEILRPTLEQLHAVNVASAFNQWAGIELVMAADGEAELTLRNSDDLRQSAGFLHAGVIGAMIDTACGFAAASLVGSVLASQYQVACYKPAVGDAFRARARVVRAGKRQVFASAELFASTDGTEQLVAGGTAVLIRTA